MVPNPTEREIGRLVLTGVAISALAIGSFAIWQVRGVDARVDEVAAHLPPVTAVTAPPLRPLAPRSDGAGGLALMRRVDDLERKLGLLLAKAEGNLPTSEGRHASDRKRIETQIAGLRREMDSLALAVSTPLVSLLPDAGGVDAEDDANEGDHGDVDEGDGGEDDGAADAGTDDAGEADAPVLVRQDKLLQTLRDETLRAVVGEFASIVGLSDAQRDEVAAIVRGRRDAHNAVTTEVSRGALSVRDASIRIDKANEDARTALSKSLTADQVQRFQTILSRLDALWWRF